MKDGIYICQGVHVPDEKAHHPDAFHVEKSLELPPEPKRIFVISPPWGEWRPHDTDREVPEYQLRAGDDYPLALSIMRGWGGVYHWHTVYNMTIIRAANITAEGWRLLRAHERAHCRGFAHGEGTRETNDAFDRAVNLRA